MLKKRITRIVAGFLSCILVGVFVSHFIKIVIDERESGYYDYSNGINSSVEVNKIYYKLWAVGMMWLRNLDEDGNFRGSEELKKQTVSALRNLDCMDKNGNLTLGDGDDFEFLVRYKDSEFSNTSKSFNELSGRFSLSRKDDFISYDDYMGMIYGNDSFNAYETNYGVHYYHLNGNTVVLYDYITDGLPSYVENDGNVIYYKTDGSTMSPENNYITQYGDNRTTYFLQDNDFDGLYDFAPYEKVFENPERYLYAEAEKVEPQETAPATPQETVSIGGVIYERVTTAVTENVSRETIPTVETTNVSRETLPTEEATNVSRETSPPEEATNVPRETSPPEEATNVSYGTLEVFNETIAIGDEYYMLNENTGAYEKIDAEKKGGVFTKYLAPERDLTIAIRPNEKLINEFNAYQIRRDDYRQGLLKRFFDYIPLPIIAVILAIYVLIVGGYNDKEKKFTMSPFEKIFAELYIALGFAVAVTSYIFLTQNSDIYDFFEKFYSTNMMIVAFGVAYALMFGVLLLIANSLIIRIKCKSFFRYTILSFVAGKVFKVAKSTNDTICHKIALRDMAKNNKFTKRFTIRTVAFALVGFFGEAIIIDYREDFLAILYGLTLVCAFYIFTIFDFKKINSVSSHISEIADGNYSPHDEPVTSPIYAITQKLNNISSGLQSAVDRQLKSERMKIDLVTNISHDLKTPLTSIISYINLLSDEELSPVAMDYVKIIENKSHHLKDMVSDLFDLAKATSRTDIDMERIDAVILINQVLADMSDKIESSGKQLKPNIKPDSAPIMAEGQKMYRVIQNLIDNAIKYSLDNTRIYLNLYDESGSCIINIKNIASYEMDFLPDEIIERFTRGDKSRSTDGNGLGLSIAKSFTEACGGSFTVSIDGDLFIAEIRIPLIP